MTLARGVTLAELACVVLIVAMTAAIAAPRMLSTWRRERLDLAARRVAADIRLARNEAIRTKGTATIAFDAAGRSYTVQGQTGQRLSTSAYTVELRKSKSSSVELVSVDFNGSAQLTFNNLGIPTSGGSVVLSDGIEKQVLTVSATTGRVSASRSAAASEGVESPGGGN